MTPISQLKQRYNERAAIENEHVTCKLYRGRWSGSVHLTIKVRVGLPASSNSCETPSSGPRHQKSENAVSHPARSRVIRRQIVCKTAYDDSEHGTNLGSHYSFPPQSPQLIRNSDHFRTCRLGQSLSLLSPQNVSAEDSCLYLP